MMTYNGNVAAYQPVSATHYATPGSIFASYGNQPYNAVQMPMNQASVSILMKFSLSKYYLIIDRSWFMWSDSCFNYWSF